MGFSSSWKTSLLSFLFGLTVPLVLPILQFGFVYRCHTFWKLITIPFQQCSHRLSIGSSSPYLLVALHSSYGLVRLWEEHAVEVKRDYCQNSCWDTVFKVGTSTKNVITGEVTPQQTRKLKVVESVSPLACC